MRTLNLNSRLKAIAELIPKGAKLADIGTDHGYLPIYCIVNSICSSCIASDLRPGPLSSAISHAQEIGVLNQVQFYCASGLDAVRPDQVDTIVIAGMGGETIRSIIDNASWIKRSDILLLLQPQSKLLELQSFINQEGFKIQKAVLAEERGRLYPIWCLRWSDTVLEEEYPYYLNYYVKDSNYSRYCRELIKKLEIRYKGMTLSQKCSEEASLIYILIEKIKRCCDDNG